jgi:hypothetical protein
MARFIQQHHVTKFASDFRKFGGFLRVLTFNKTDNRGLIIEISL